MTHRKDNPYQNLFDAQKQRQSVIAQTSAKERLAKLNRLHTAVTKTFKDDIRQALASDFKKPQVETDLTEIYLVVSEIKHAKAHLRRWMAKQHVNTPIALLGTSSYYSYEPKGVCLIISPWNYPISLSFSPLVSAISAGNTAIIKPSEYTPNSSKVISKIIDSIYEASEVVVIEGEVETASQLLELPFNHIFFTGSTSVGKLVMEAASKHLASVTLELGGKSPTFIDGTADLKYAARSIIWTKFLNNGQTCIAPDYILIAEEIKEEFVKHCKYYIQKFYGDEPESSDDYSRTVNQSHFNRLKDYLKEAKQKNAHFEHGGNVFSEENYIEPTIISELPKDIKLLNEEIFGPILPILTYKSLDEAIDYVNEKEKPLSLYIYSKSKASINRLLRETSAGTTGINNVGFQFVNNHLPFGGVNHSGIGKSHGFFGFEEFSNKRAVLKRNFTGPISLLRPPYTKWVQKLTDLTIKWF